MKDMSLVRTLSYVSPQSHPPLHTIKMTNYDEKKKFICLTPNRPLIHTCFTYPKLNMDDFSALYGGFVYVDSTKKV